MNGYSAEEVFRDIIRTQTGERHLTHIECVRRAVSGVSLGVSFTDVIHASIVRGYNENVGTIGWTDQQILTNLKTDRHRMPQSPNLTLSPGGAVAPTSESQGTSVIESYRLARYGAHHAIDERDLADDTLRVLVDVPRMYGVAAARLVADLAYTELLSNSTAMGDGDVLFHANHNNLFTGALTGTNLDSAIENLISQTEGDGNVPLNPQPKYLLVPPGLVGTARKLVRERALDDDGDLIVVTDSRLLSVRNPATGDTVTGSATSWYLSAQQSQAPIELGFFDRQAPTIGTGLLENGKWGVWFDVKMEIGVKPVRAKTIVRYDV